MSTGGKKKPNLTISEGPGNGTREEDKGVSITDTLTLQVDVPLQRPGIGASDAVEQVRVKEDGVKRAANVGESATDKINFDDLKIGQVIGEGSQAKVRKAIHSKTNVMYALKQLTFTDDKEAMRKVLQTELRSVVSMPSHPHLVTSMEAFFRNGILMILMEFMENGTLSAIYKKAGRIPDDVLKVVAKHLFSGLVFLHQNKIVHRDIKPSNLLVNKQGVTKISDFGVSAYVQASKLHQTTAPVGSTPYMSPERVRGDPYSFASDVWSAGVTIAECSVGFYPFGAQMKSKTFDLCSMIAENRLTVTWASPSEELKSFVMLCLTHDPDKRPSAEEMLAHPFVTSADESQDLANWFKDPPILQ
jgi:serine/threonine protein kinase